MSTASVPLVQTGETVAGYVLGPSMGQGAFGEIFAVRNSKDTKLYALKVEPSDNKRAILEFETNVLKKLSPSPYFPKFMGAGKTDTFNWLAMELLGPSLATVVKRLPQNRVSISTGLRVALFILDGLEAMHVRGFIHRDLKPSNILLRRNREYPVVIIDFGLSRVYVDRRSGSHLAARQHPGFRGTAVYASPNAHMHQDLSRRDDLISWFYIIIDIMIGPLPWKRIDNRTEILHMKRRVSMEALAQRISPQLVQIWDMISSLSYNDRPFYEEIRRLLHEACNEKGVKATDEWDWHPLILHIDSSEEQNYEEARRFEGSSYTSEVTGSTEIEARRRSSLSNAPLLSNARVSNRHLDCCCTII